MVLVAAACTSQTGSTWSHAPRRAIDTPTTSESIASSAPARTPTPIDPDTATGQLVTDVARGFQLYQINCAACHGPDGQGGTGPRLNDQAKLYRALTPAGGPGSGYLDPVFIDELLTEGGAYVCGDPGSLMLAYKQPNGHLTDRQVEQLIAWITASSEIVIDSGSGLVPGWRDQDWEPGPATTPVPACWQD
jgi:mono/diheme cytochrome c family protein